MYLFYYIRAFTFFSKEKKKKKKLIVGVEYHRCWLAAKVQACITSCSHMKKNLVKPKWYFIHDFGNSIVDENEK